MPQVWQPSDAQQAEQEETPLLWVASCLASDLQAKLQAHFQPHTAAGRLDKPQWLFKLVLRLVQVGWCARVRQTRGALGKGQWLGCNAMKSQII